jgi:hypothetical protein
VRETWNKAWRQALSSTVIGLAAAFVVLAPEAAQAQTTTGTLCTARGYTVGFFNGIWNSWASAESGKKSLQAAVGSHYNGEPISYEVYYNQTGSSQAGATGAQDVAEVFIQRALEYDNSGELGQRFEYLWDVLSDGERPLWQRLTNTVGGGALVADGMYTSLMTKALAGWSAMLSNPPTSVDSAQQRTQIETHALQGQKLLLVAHSQGNLFMNAAYDHAKSKYGTDSVAAVHIAPASSTLRGEHVLTYIDIVINLLRTTGWNSVPDNNLTMVPSFRDLSGHQLAATYLDRTRAARGRVQQMAYTGLQKMVTPTAQASKGFFTAMLTWDGSGDVDLHTTEPGGAHVYYASLRGRSGELDVDNTVRDGPEHYFASCDASVLQAGTYQFGINNYAGASGRTATVQVSFAQGGQPVTRTLSVGPVRGPAGDNSPIPVVTVTVTRDANGRFQASAI